MKSTVLATAVAAVLTLIAADASAHTKGAATKAAVQSIQSQMQALARQHPLLLPVVLPGRWANGF